MKTDTEINEKDNTALIRVEGKITIETVPDFEEMLYELINSGLRVITINMKKVYFIDSSALGALIRIKNVSGKSGCELKLINVQKDVISIFKFTNLESFFLIDSE